MDLATYEGFRERFSHRVANEHLFKGVLECRGWMEMASDDFDNFQLKEDDVIVSTYPKAGTTWTQEIVWLLKNRGDFEKAKSAIISQRFPCIDMNLDNITNMSPPRLIKTHLPYHVFKSIWSAENTAAPKLIYVARNPKDVAVSYYHFYRANGSLGNYTGTWDEFFDMYKAGYVCCNDWFTHTLEWYEVAKKSTQILFVKYEDMIENLYREVERMQNFLGTENSKEILEKICQHVAFDNMKKNPMANMTHAPVSIIDHGISPFIRKGQVGDWKNHFTVAQNEVYMEEYKEKMKNTDLSFRFE